MLNAHTNNEPDFLNAMCLDCEHKAYRFYYGTVWSNLLDPRSDLAEECVIPILLFLRMTEFSD